MIHVFHLFKKAAKILKPDYTPDVRKSFFDWPDQVNSRLGILDSGKLLLPDSEKEKIPVRRTGTVIIQDILGYSDTSAKADYLYRAKKLDLPEWYIESHLKQFQELTVFNSEDKKRNFEIFSINLEKQELFLRDQYKLCSLRIGEPVRVRLNGKSDSTMSRGKQRTYSEYDYIVEYLGAVETIEFAAESKLEVKREIPWKTAKVIDLRKAFY